VFSNPNSLIDPLGLCAVDSRENWTNALINRILNFWLEQSYYGFDSFSDSWVKFKDLLNFLIGNKPGDIFTIGFSFGTKWFVGGGFSFDRIIMPNGEVDWFFTFGAGFSTPGFSVSADRGKILKLDVIRNKDSKLYLNSKNISKEDIEGFSLSSNVDFAYVAGAEGVFIPFPTSKAKDVEYPTPLVILKGGPRISSGFAANFFGNWTWDIGR
jgi:hypothetical protein